MGSGGGGGNKGRVTPEEEEAGDKEATAEAGAGPRGGGRGGEGGGSAAAEAQRRNEMAASGMRRRRLLTGACVREAEDGDKGKKTAEDVNKRKVAHLKSLGRMAVEREDYLSASGFYSKAMDLDSDDATLFSNRSLCLLHMGDAQKALADALACRKMRPDWPKACYRQGAALMLLKDFESACEAFFDGFKMDPKNAEIEHALRYSFDSEHAYACFKTFHWFQLQS
nr:unnamed protein product [Digitaria exilis]